LNLTTLIHGQNCLNSIYFRVRPTNALPDIWYACDHLSIAFRDEVLPLWRPVVSQDVQFVGTVVQCLTPRNTAQTITAYNNILGQYVGAALPSHDAALISFYTQAPGRRAHGRMYLTGIPMAEVTQGIMSVGHKAKLDALAARWIAFYGFASSIGQWWGVVFSRKNGRTRDPGPPPAYNYDVLAGQPWTRAETKSQIFTQRHRLRGKGV
jgi:hypothetical protein